MTKDKLGRLASLANKEGKETQGKSEGQGHRGCQEPREELAQRGSPDKMQRLALPAFQENRAPKDTVERRGPTGSWLRGVIKESRAHRETGDLKEKREAKEAAASLGLQDTLGYLGVEAQPGSQDHQDLWEISERLGLLDLLAHRGNSGQREQKVSQESMVLRASRERWASGDMLDLRGRPVLTGRSGSQVSAARRETQGRTVHWVQRETLGVRATRVQ
ncbi:unnamed protein product [Gadus morhua 'NCC']